MEYKHLLITGGSGFIGSHIINLLLKRKYFITVVDIIEPKIKGANFIMGDFADERIMAPVLRNFDAVIHLAAIIGVDECRLYPEKVMKVNYKNSKKFIDMCIQNGIKRFVFSSSSEVYGNSISIPYYEDAEPTPISLYGKTKTLTEEYLKKNQSTGDMTIGIARLFNVYGPWQRASFVLPRFINSAINNEPLDILGDGEQIRCFTYISDAVIGIVKLLKYNKTPYEIVNIGRRREYTINEVARIVLDKIPSSKSQMRYVPYGGDRRELSLEIKRRVPSVEKAKLLFNFEAKTSLEEGISKIVSL